MFGFVASWPKSWFILPGAAVSVTVFAVFLLCHVSAPAVPRLAMNYHSMRLEGGEPGQIVSGKFEIRNRGTSPLVFDLTPSCGCSELNPTHGTLEPGEARNVFVGVRLGTEIEKSISIAINTNDPEDPTHRFTVFVACRLPLVVTPESIDFGRVLEGTGGSATVHVLGAGGEPLHDPDGVSFTSSNPQFRVERGATGPDGLAFSVSLSETAPRGYPVGSIDMGLANDPARVRVTAVAEVLAPVLAAPSFLMLGKGTEPNGPGWASFMVWRPDGKPLGPLIKIEASPGLVVEEVGQARGRPRRFRARARGGVRPVGGQIIMRFQNATEPVVVRIASLTDT